MNWGERLSILDTNSRLVHAKRSMVQGRKDREHPLRGRLAGGNDRTPSRKTSAPRLVLSGEPT